MPTYGEIAQIITALAAFGAFVLSWRNARKIEQVHKATNSMMDKLVETTKTEAHAAGLKEGRAERTE
jgi:hypothetical protein